MEQVNNGYMFDINATL